MPTSLTGNTIATSKDQDQGARKHQDGNPTSPPGAAQGHQAQGVVYARMQVQPHSRKRMQTIVSYAKSKVADPGNIPRKKGKAHARDTTKRAIPWERNARISTYSLPIGRRTDLNRTTTSARLTTRKKMRMTNIKPHNSSKTKHFSIARQEKMCTL
ncbi:hypothetical protein MCOR06_011893 [Pyricularia oryzae]|nr:hypothetical protein MCOR06_011893 [Pyricularia oryzae]